MSPEKAAIFIAKTLRKKHSSTAWRSGNTAKVLPDVSLNSA